MKCLMKTRPLTIVISALLAVEISRAQSVPALERLPFQRWVETLSPDGKQVVAINPPKERAIAGQFSLSQENITTEITDAYRYDGNVVVFGWSGHSNGIVTVIDAVDGKEKLQLLVNERSRFVTPNGALVYAHWFVPGAFEPDDSVWLLDLNHPFPQPKVVVPNVAEQVGLQIYPSAKDPKGRHTLVAMLPSGDGRTLFLADRLGVGPESREVCFVAIDLSNLSNVMNRHNCMDERALSGYPPDQIRSRNLTITTSGGLQYSIRVAGEADKEERFEVDTATLTPSKAK